MKTTTNAAGWVVELEGRTETGEWALVVVPAEFPTRRAAEKFAAGVRAARPDVTARVVRQ